MASIRRKLYGIKCSRVKRHVMSRKVNRPRSYQLTPWDWGALSPRECWGSQKELLTTRIIRSQVNKESNRLDANTCVLPQSFVISPFIKGFYHLRDAHSHLNITV